MRNYRRCNPDQPDLRTPWQTRMPEVRRFSTHVDLRAAIASNSICAPQVHHRPRPCSGRSSAWIERLVWVQEVVCSNHIAPILRPKAEYVFSVLGSGSFCPNAVRRAIWSGWLSQAGARRREKDGKKCLTRCLAR